MCLSKRFVNGSTGFIPFLVLQIFLLTSQPSAQIGNYASSTTSGRSIIITSSSGERIRLTPYGDYIVRVQAIRSSESFYPDSRYEMVASHNWTGTLTLVDAGSSLQVTTTAADGI
jgi:hypothetical protein